jgi:hypothetical protein
MGGRRVFKQTFTEMADKSGAPCLHHNVPGPVSGGRADGGAQCGSGRHYALSTVGADAARELW